MTSFVQNVTFDCADAYTLARFWSEVTGQPVSEEDQPGDPEALVSLPSGVDLVFCQVPEGKTVKNRVHVCLRPDEGPRDAEVERLLGIGASLVADKRNPDGTGWAVLADPEGNEFCVLRGRAEVEAGPAH
ncbi:VOC family protein [Amycolatopsis samaneae]|uniref:VOC family protein n=1 Tax=Amycolatopsis samaneae TaxID=664691 RepID=A0ABW5GAV6_9PSEU